MTRTVLVVEDNPDEMEITRETLTEAGFAIGTASNGVDALKKVRTVPPDVILLDAVMPGLSGFAVCETLRENPATSSIPILMLTGLSSHISQITAFESGATDYLIKPFVLEELVFKVKKLLDKVDKADQLAAEQKKLASQDSSCLHEWLSQAPSGGE